MEDVNGIIQAAKEKMSEMTESLKEQFVSKEELTQATAALDLAKKEFNDLVSIVEKQGKLINAESTMEQKVNGLKNFIQKYKEATEARRNNEETVVFNVVEKAWDSLDTISVDDADTTAYPANGTAGFFEHADGETPANSFNIKPYFSQFAGFISKPTPQSRVLDLVDVTPLVAGRMYAFVDGVVGQAQVTPECELKPIVKPSLDVIAADAQTVAVFWKISNKFLKFYDMIASRFVQKLGELINIKLPALVLNAITQGGTAFSMPSGLATVQSPNNYDALVAAAVSLEMMGYTPNGIVISPVDLANMKLTKGWDSNYSLSNNGSIALVNGNLEYNGEIIPYIKDATLAPGTLLVGDFSTVKVGMDAGLDFRQGHNDNDDLRRNLTANVLEKDFVVLVADSTAIVKDTFANVKTAMLSSEVACLPICAEGDDI